LNDREQRRTPESNDEHGTPLTGYLGKTPPRARLPERGERAWVDRPEQLASAVAALKDAPVIAIDAEFAQVRSHAQGAGSSSTTRLALLQLAIDGKCFVVDALRLFDLSPLAPIIENPAISILLHGAGADMRMMSERGLNVAHYYDLEATCRSLFGQHESSLAAMLLRAFGARLDKSLQRTDWARRPLPSAMIAYAARDAEMTLALYYWLLDHFAWALQLHDSVNLATPVAAWIAPYLRGNAPVPPDVAIAEAIQQGVIQDKNQVVQDCQDALERLIHPMQRSRLLRLITDLNLAQLAPRIEPMLLALTSDERAAAIRALSRLDGKQYNEAIRPLLQDPVSDVRKAAQTALRIPVQKEPKPNWSAPVKQADGARSWTIGETQEGGDDDDWKARLRSLMGG
jgi:hypothetical protein